MPATTPKTKAELEALVDTYIPATGYPNIRATELVDLNTKILDRVDGRILNTGTFVIANFTGYRQQNITFPSEVYTNQYIVMLTPVGSSVYNGAFAPGTQTTPQSYPYRATYTIANRTKFGFTILMQANSSATTCRFWYAVFSKAPL